MRINQNDQFVKTISFQGDIDSNESINLDYDTRNLMDSTQLNLVIEDDNQIRLTFDSVDIKSINDFLNKSYCEKTNKLLSTDGFFEINDPAGLASFKLYYDTMGEPFRDGIRFLIESKVAGDCSCLVSKNDTISLISFLDKLILEQKL